MAGSAQDRVLAGEVSKIWSMFDQDGNGVLDKDEMRQFIVEMTNGLLQEEQITKESIDAVFA